MKIFTERLKEERLLSKLSQADMAAKLNIPLSTYGHYEQTGLSNRQPPFAVLVEIAKILDVSLDYLFGLVD